MLQVELSLLRLSFMLILYSGSNLSLSLSTELQLLVESIPKNDNCLLLFVHLALWRLWYMSFVLWQPTWLEEQWHQLSASQLLLTSSKIWFFMSNLLCHTLGNIVSSKFKGQIREVLLYCYLSTVWQTILRDSARDLGVKLTPCVCSHSSCPDWQQTVTNPVAIHG